MADDGATVVSVQAVWVGNPQDVGREMRLRRPKQKKEKEPASSVTAVQLPAL